MDYTNFPPNCVSAVSLILTYPKYKKYLDGSVKIEENSKVKIKTTVKKEEQVDFVEWINTVYINSIEFLIKLPFLGEFKEYRVKIVGEPTEEYISSRLSSWDINIEFTEGDVQLNTDELKILVRDMNMELKHEIHDIYRDENNINYITLDFIPNGIISLVLTIDNEDVEIDDLPTTVGKKLEIRADEDLTGSSANVRYLALH